MSRSDRSAGSGGKIPGTVLAVAGGLAWAACFGERGLLMAPWVALAPLFFLLGRSRAITLTWLHGTVFWLASLYWIVDTIKVYGRVPPLLSVLGLVLLAAFLSLLFWLPFGLLGRRFWRAGGWALYLGLPALWTALEWAREYVLSGFPWNLAAYAAVGVPGARPLTAWVGSYGLSFLLVAVNVALAGAIDRRRKLPVLAAGVLW